MFGHYAAVVLYSSWLLHLYGVFRETPAKCFLRKMCIAQTKKKKKKVYAILVAA